MGAYSRANSVELERSDAAIQDLNDWFYAHVEPDPDNAGRLLPDWYSVVNDIALFLGEVMIERHPNLRWEFFTRGRKSVSYHRPVIMGFSREDPKFHTNIDTDRMVAAHGHRIVRQGGSVPSYGTVTVRGAQIDVDAITAWVFDFAPGSCRTRSPRVKILRRTGRSASAPRRRPGRQRERARDRARRRQR